jgi:GINS complex subunit 2
VSNIYRFSGIPVHVPLWLAIHLRKQQKCRLVPPEWMDKDLLEELKEEEKRSK